MFEMLTVGQLIVMLCNSCAFRIIKKNAVYTDMNRVPDLRNNTTSAAYSAKPKVLCVFIHSN